MGDPDLKALQREIEELKKENLSLKFEREEFKTIFMIAKNGIALLDLDSNFLSVNPAYIEMSGYTEEELLKLSCIGLSIDEDIPRSIAIMEEVARVGYVKNYEKTCIIKSGKRITINMSMALLPDKKSILINTTDITEIRQLQVELYKKKEILKKQAFYDYLTEIPNRILFNEQLEHSILRAQQSGEKFALLFIDLDRFKMINDTYGHDIGDKSLVEIASKINAEVSSSDTFARIGGDEFAIILNKLSDKSEAAHLADKIINLLESINQIDKYHINISASIGITMYPQDTNAAKDLLINADIAMYGVKKMKDKKYIFYTKEMSMGE